MKRTGQSGKNNISILLMLFWCIVPLETSLAENLKSPSISEGKCLRFDGINDVVNAGRIEAFDNSQQFTAEMWVRIDQFDAWKTFFCIFQNLANRIQFQQYSEPGKIAVVVNNGADIAKEGNQGYFYTENPEVTIGDWFHLAMVFDGTQPEEQRLKLYINGLERVLKKDGSAKGIVPDRIPSTKAPLLVGAEKPNGQFGFNGLMDEIRIWTIARSEQQIRDNLEYELEGSVEGLKLYYAIDSLSEANQSLADRVSEKQKAKLVNLDLNSCFVDREISEPVTMSSELKTEQINANQANIAWVRGSGIANAVFVTESDSGSPSPEPGVSYKASPEFAKGSRIEGTNWYCVYNGYGSAISISGLLPSTSYRVAIVDYNGTSGREKYIADSLTPIISINTPAMVKKSQQIIFIPPAEINTNKKLMVLHASASSNLPVTFTSNNKSIARISGDTLFIRSAGEISITASQPGDENWDAAKDVTSVLNVIEDNPSNPKKPVAHSSPVNFKERTILVAGGVVFLAGTIFSLILAGSDDNNAENPNINDRPPGDPVMGSIH